jgi:hypothetical protein
MGLGKRIGYSLRCFFSILLYGQIPGSIALELGATSAAGGRVTPSDKPGPQEAEARLPSYDRAVQMLALLQREGRLIDFFAEDVTPYPDAQLGAAVRSVHQSCRQALEHYVKLEPIISSEEDRPVTVQAGFDPAAIKVIGNVTGKPPLRGLLRHRGWRATQVNLPSLPEGEGRTVVAPAEVEIP